MIIIADKTKCCGCWACQQVCPDKCISMDEDKEGFLYPVVNATKCSDCGLCERVCPVINQNNSIVKEPASYACINNDKIIRENSSSGGLFSLLAEETINGGGIVFGAKFDDDWNVVHDYAETIDGLTVFIGSKYVESRIGCNYKKVKEFLQNGRKVLFSGTPCQIAGLNHFLKIKYENLITVDLVCHSVPSPKIWKMYLRELIDSKEIINKTDIIITDINFRSKSNGWKEYSIEIMGAVGVEFKKEISLLTEKHIENSYMRGFLQDLYVRPSCSKCPARNFTSGSDIQIADFWGVEKYYPEIKIANDDKGVSLALIVTAKGQAVFDTIASKMFSFRIKYNEVEDRGLHAPLTRSTPAHKKRKMFYKRLENMSIKRNIEQCLKEEELKNSLLMGMKNIIRNIVGKRGYEYLKRLR